MMRALLAITAREFSGYFATPWPLYLSLCFCWPMAWRHFIWARIFQWAKPI